MALNPTPTGVGLYSRFQAASFNEKSIIGVPSAWRAFFGDPASAGSRTMFSDTAAIFDVDIKRGDEKTSKINLRGNIVRPLGSNVKSLSVEKFTSFSRKFPIIPELGDIGADQLDYRMFSDSPYAERSRIDKVRMLTADMHAEQMRRQLRLWERLCAQSMLTGAQDAGGGETYDFERNSNLTDTVGTAWSDVAAPALTDIDDACTAMRQYGRVTPDMIVFGRTSIAEFLNNTEVKDKADNRRFDLIRVGPDNPVPRNMQRFVDGGFDPRGLLITPVGRKLWMFTTDDIYDTDAGVATPYIGDEQVFLAKSDAQRDRYFGPPEWLPPSPADVQEMQYYTGINAGLTVPSVPGAGVGPIPIGAFYFDFYKDRNKKAFTVETQSAPVFVPTQVDASFLLNT